MADPANTNSCPPRILALLLIEISTWVPFVHKPYVDYSLFLPDWSGEALRTKIAAVVGFGSYEHLREMQTLGNLV